MIHEHNSYLCSAWNNSLLRVFRSLARLAIIIMQWRYCLLQTHRVPLCVCVRCLIFTRCTIHYCEHVYRQQQRQQQQLATFKRIFVNKCQNESVNKSEMDEIDASEEVTLQTSSQKKREKRSTLSWRTRIAWEKKFSILASASRHWEIGAK